LIPNDATCTNIPISVKNFNNQVRILKCMMKMIRGEKNRTKLNRVPAERKYARRI
jgi:hypothetical protein